MSEEYIIDDIEIGSVFQVQVDGKTVYLTPVDSTHVAYDCEECYFGMHDMKKFVRNGKELPRCTEGEVDCSVISCTSSERRDGINVHFVEP